MGTDDICSLIYKTKVHRLTSEASYPLHSKSSDDEMLKLATVKLELSALSRVPIHTPLLHFQALHQPLRCALVRWHALILGP
jgi:hypothetical protein